MQRRFAIARRAHRPICRATPRIDSGWDTRRREQDFTLSAARKSLAAIARTLLKRPKILIFDEATSRLDLQTAEHFAQTVNQLTGKVTMLFIAHNLPRNLIVDAVFNLGATAAAADKPAG